MAQSKILLDSNSYFRLAKSIHPLLDVVFGEENYCLYVLKELDDEFQKNRRLQTQFSWVNEEEYAVNRRKRLTLSRKERRQIDLAIEFFQQHKIENNLGVSLVDILCLAYGHVLSVSVVTDDDDMLNVAKHFKMHSMKTLELLHLMLNCGHIDMAIIQQIVAYWKYMSDKPAGFRQDYIRLFKLSPP